ncbi:flagellar hook-associated protein FlgL [Stutzerimonas urumqiensis]|uniref:flagellar hook-associated protein FlgL n=1 Tax=Stutzerimonas urumqiensis TaxID=638269 RepID=UPI003DA5AD12
MRISTLQAFNNGVSGLQRNYSDVTRTQEQISTGKRLLTPADDPVASVRLLQLGQEEAMNAQYKTGITAAKNSLTAEETILTSVGNVIQRIRELAVQSGNGALDSSDRGAIASELAQREDELLNLMNSRDADGKYLFSGSMGDTQPFVRNADGTYTYQGDQGQRNVQIASSSFVGVGDSGHMAFENIVNAARVTTNVDAANAGDALISRGLVTDGAAYRQFQDSYPNGVGVRFTSDKDYYLYDLTAPADPPVAITGSAGSFDDEPLSENIVKFGGVEFEISGTPQNGDRFTLESDRTAEKRSLLNVVRDLRVGLEAAVDSPDGNFAARDVTAIALTNLDAASAQVLSVQGKIGARLNVIDTTDTFISDVSLVNKAVQSELEDLDYPEALARMSMQSTVLQAAQQSYVKISGLSLFNFLS